MNKVGIFYSEKILYFLHKRLIQFIFSLQQNNVFGNLGTGTFFKRFYKKDVRQKLRYACCDVNIKCNDVTV